MKASEFIKKKNSDYGLYDNETGLRVIDALLRSSRKENGNESTRETLIDSELEKIRTKNKLAKLYPRIKMTGVKRWNDIAAEHAKEERAKRVEIVIRSLVNKELHKKARQNIAKKAQQKAQKIISVKNNRIL